MKLFGLRQMLLGMPKLRGFTSRYMKAATVTLPSLSKTFSAGERVDMTMLKAKNLVHPSTMTVKIVGKDGIDKPLVLINMMVSQSAKAAIEKVGGKLERTKEVAKVKKMPLAKKAKRA